MVLGVSRTTDSTIGITLDRIIDRTIDRTTDRHSSVTNSCYQINRDLLTLIGANGDVQVSKIM